jgi:hypothetical protein
LGDVYNHRRMSLQHFGDRLGELTNRLLLQNGYARKLALADYDMTRKNLRASAQLQRVPHGVTPGKRPNCKSTARGRAEQNRPGLRGAGSRTSSHS